MHATLEEGEPMTSRKFASVAARTAALAALATVVALTPGCDLGLAGKHDDCTEGRWRCHGQVLQSCYGGTWITREVCGFGNGNDTFCDTLHHQCVRQ
jgi:hypothetical protein